MSYSINQLTQKTLHCYVECENLTGVRVSFCFGIDQLKNGYKYMTNVTMVAEHCHKVHNKMCILYLHMHYILGLV